MSDCVLFASLFAAYAVLHTATAGGPQAFELFDLHFVFIETMLLLASSYTCGLALLFAHEGSARRTGIALFATLILGLGFLGMELHEFSGLLAEGHGPAASAFLSSFFTLVGTHGLHIAAGSLWMLALFLHIGKNGITERTLQSIRSFSLFWHFLDIVWICIFSFVYLFGALSL
jgi:cytochrome o ubiquinol oxidase subunit 3